MMVPEVSPQPRTLLTTSDVMRRLKASRTTVWRLAERGELTRVRIGGLVRYDARELEELIERGRIGS